MGEIEVRKALKKLGHLVAAKIAAMPAGSHGAEIIVCPPHEIAISLQPLDRGPWAFPAETTDDVHLTPKEMKVLAKCPLVEPKTAKEIAKAVGEPNTSNFRRVLSNLQQKGKLKKTDGGYLAI
jgi:hypothetical protein